MNYRGFVANQALYNVGSKHMKRMEDDTLVVVDQEMLQYHRDNSEIILMPYMSVCSGFFNKLISGDRKAKMMPYYTQENLAVSERIRSLCEEKSISVTQAVLGFFLTRKCQCIPLYGPKDDKQIIDALNTFKYSFSASDYSINKVKN